jgi:uncharacterized protein YjlB
MAPYHFGHTGTHSITEVKQHWASIVIGGADYAITENAIKL